MRAPVRWFPYAPRRNTRNILQLSDKKIPLPVFFLPFMAAITALSPLSIDAYLPSFPAIAAEFGVNPLDINFTMSTYLVGLAMGQLLGGPISDQIGRKRVGMIGLLAYLLFTLLILASQNLEQLAILRAFQALGGGLASSIAMPSIRDVSAPEKAAGRLALMTLFMLAAPLVAPVIGVILLSWGWRFIFGFLCVYGGLLCLIYLFGIKETRTETVSKPNLLEIFRQYGSVFQHRLEGKRFPIRYALANAFAVATMMIYLTNASFLFQTYFAVDINWFPALFAINVIFFAIAQAFSARYLKNCSLQKTADYYRAGHRIQFCSTVILLVSVLLFEPPLWFFVFFLGCSLGCIGLIGPSGSGIYLAAFSRLSGSASSLLTVGYFLIGALIGGVSGLFKTGDLVPLTLALFCASLAANLVIASISRKEEAGVMQKLGSGDIQPL